MDNYYWRFRSLGNCDLKKVNAFIEIAKDGSYTIHSNNNSIIIIGTGSSIDNAKYDFLETYNNIKDDFKQKNLHFKEVEFNFVYDTITFLKDYSKIIPLTGISYLTGIDQSKLNSYITGERKPSVKTIDKIRYGLCKVSREVRQIFPYLIHYNS